MTWQQNDTSSAKPLCYLWIYKWKVGWKDTCAIYNNAPNSQSHKEPCLNGWEYCASNQGVWSLCFQGSMGEETIYWRLWPKCFHRLGICCEKSCFVSIYPFHILRAGPSFICPVGLLDISVHFICSRQRVVLRKGPTPVKPWFPPQDSLFPYWKMTLIAYSVPRFGRWTCLVTPILILCPNQESCFLSRRSQLWSHRAWLKSHFCHS